MANTARSDKPWQQAIQEPRIAKSATTSPSLRAILRSKCLCVLAARASTTKNAFNPTRETSQLLKKIGDALTVKGVQTASRNSVKIS